MSSDGADETTTAGSSGRRDPAAGVLDALADGVDVVEVDVRGQRLVVSSAQVLGGLLAAGLLRHVRSPGALVDVLAPEVPPGQERDRLVFTAGAAAGLWAGRRQRAGQWDPEELRETADDLYAAGWAAMGSVVERAATVTANLPPWGRDPGAGGGW